MMTQVNIKLHIYLFFCILNVSTFYVTYVHRERYVLIDDYDKLELIESADFETNRWALFNTQVIHSVENIERKRVSIQISIDSITTNLYHEI